MKYTYYIVYSIEFGNGELCPPSSKIYETESPLTDAEGIAKLYEHFYRPALVHNWIFLNQKD